MSFIICHYYADTLLSIRLLKEDRIFRTFLMISYPGNAVSSLIFSLMYPFVYISFDKKRVICFNLSGRFGFVRFLFIICFSTTSVYI